MTLQQCQNDLWTYEYLIGQKIEYNGEKFSVVHLLIVPKSAVEVKLFLHYYLERKLGANNSLNPFMNSDLELILECSKHADSQLKFLRPADVIVVT